MRITLGNDFHRTSTRVTVDPDGTIPRNRMERAVRRLCGIPTCTCGGMRGPNPRIEPTGDSNSDYILID